MFKKLKLVLLPLSACLVHCSSVGVYDNASTAKALDKAVVDAGAQMQVWQQELGRHRGIIKKMEAKSPASWPAVANQGRSLMKSLEAGASRLDARYKELVAQRADYSFFAHSNPKIHSNDSKWSESERWAQENVEATQAFNESLKAYSATSHSLNAFWAENKLLQKRDVTKLADELQSDSVKWREDYNQLVGHFNAGQAMLSESPDRGPSGLNALQRMHEHLAAMSKLIADLDKVKENYFNAFAGMQEITSLDAQWDQWHGFQKKQQALESEFKLLKQKYKSAHEELGAAFKESVQLVVATEDQKQSLQ